METFLLFAASLALLGIAALCVYAIIMIKDARQVLLSMNRSLLDALQAGQKLGNELEPTFKNINQTLQQTTLTMHSLQTQIDGAGQAIEQFKEMAVRINELESRVQSKIEKPVMQAASILSGITSAISTFSSVLRKK
jgi:uncharacterized protein YoxC